MFKAWLAKTAQVFEITPEMAENILLSLIIGMAYLLGRFIAYRALEKLERERLRETIRDVVPSLLRLIALGVMLKIWLAGKASLATFFAIHDQTMGKVVETIYVYLFYVGAKLLGNALLSFHYHGEPAKNYSSRRTMHVVLGIISAVMLFKIWIATTADFSTYLGLLSAGLAIALQDVIISVVAWVYLMVVKPFKVGDRIQLGEAKGDIIDIKLLQFSMLEIGQWVGADQPTGRIMSFPNSFVFKNPIANYHMGFEFIFCELPIMVTFESDWQKALKILQRVLDEIVGAENQEARRQIQRAAMTMRLVFTHLEPKIITSVADSGVVLTMRFLCRIRDRRFVEGKIWERVLEDFAKEESIDFAYPTQRYYLNYKEGKSEAGGPASAFD